MKTSTSVNIEKNYSAGSNYVMPVAETAAKTSAVIGSGKITGQGVNPPRTLICIPAYNEGENIGAVLDGISAAEKNKFNCGDGVVGDFDILVVDDGSSDETRENCLGRAGVTVISHIFNMGYGAALKSAYKYAADHDYDYIIQIDADGQHDVSNIGRIFETLTSGAGNPDIVIGSRFMQGSVGFKISSLKHLAISFFRFIIKAIVKMNITDPTSGLQGINRRAILYYARYKTFSIDYPDANMIIKMALKGFKIREIPAVMHPRVAGVSMHSGIFKQMKYLIIMSLSILVVCMRAARSKRNGEGNKK